MEVVIAIDEAHLLEKDTIEEIRFLMNSDMDSKNPICLILSGQLELWERLEMRSSVAIKQRVDIMCRLAPFSRDETSDYIQYRLRRAGVERTVFTDEAVDQIYGQTSGIPRKIDKLCDRCLMRGYIENSKLINDHTVKIIAQTEMM
jgi:type II secretory pathway predicted ATPase ExeA